MERLLHCPRGTPNTPCPRTELRTLEDQRPPQVHQFPNHNPFPAHAVPMGPQILDVRPFGQTQKVKKEGFRLEFDWHIPFTSRKKKTRASFPPLHQPLQQAVPMQYPAQSPQLRPVSWGTQSAPPHPPPPPHSAAVVVVEPDRGRSRDRRSSRDEHRPEVHFPTRVHERRSRGQANHEDDRRRHPHSPGRRNQSRGRLERITRRLERLEKELDEWKRRAQTAERLQNEMEESHRRACVAERTEALLAQIRDTQAQHAMEREAERRWQEQEEAHLRYEEEQRRRPRRGTARIVEVHQMRDDNLNDRGARVLGQAMQDELDRQAGRRARSRGLDSRPEGNGLRRRGTHAGEEIVYDDESRWAWRRRR